MLFGQLIPIGGFANGGDGPGRAYTYKTLKTQELKEIRHDELDALDDTHQTIQSNHELLQYNQIKKILMNFAFKEKDKNKEKTILSIDINADVLDEMRRQRKIVMVLRDANVDAYIQQNMTEFDIENKESWKDCDPELQLMIQDKLDFRERFAQNVSITRLDYMIRVLRTIFKKATISDPDAFKDKIKAMERKEKIDMLMKRIKSTSSFRSMYSKSQKTGITDRTGDDQTELDELEADDDAATNTTRGISSDPVFMSLNNFFDVMQEELETNATTRIEYIKRVVKNGKRRDVQEVNLQ